MFVTLYLEIQSGLLNAIYLFIAIFISYLSADLFDFWVSIIYNVSKLHWSLFVSRRW